MQVFDKKNYYSFFKQFLTVLCKNYPCNNILLFDIQYVGCLKFNGSTLT